MRNNIDRFKNIKNFCLYYGYGNEDRLCRYDLAIVEPKAHLNDSIMKIKANNSLLIAYISVMEISEHDEKFNNLNSNDFLNSNGAPFINKKYNNYILNLASKNWTNIILGKMNTLVLDGYDGFFLDTIGDIEDNHLSKEQAEDQLFASLLLIKKIRTQFPTSIIIQNNGLEQLASQSRTYVDAICWENPPYQLKDSKQWISDMSHKLNEMCILGTGKKLIILFEKKNLPKNLLQKMRLNKFLNGLETSIVYWADDDYV